MPKRLWVIVSLLTCIAARTGAAQQTPGGILNGGFGWYLPTDDRAGSLFLFELGKGEPVVVLHGGPGADLTYMLPIASGLENAFRFVFYDQRGSLRSRFPIDSVSMPKHVADLETIRRALGVERLTLASHSAGTLLAFEYLAAHPDRVANLVLVGALPHKNGSAYFDAEYAELWKPLPAAQQAFAQRAIVADELRKAGLDHDSLAPRDAGLALLIRQVSGEMVHVERWRSGLPMRVNPDAARVTRATTQLVYDYGPLLGAHPFPVTVINGEEDYVVGPRGSPLWRRLTETVAPRVKLVVIPDASHLVWRDAPERFRDELQRALTAHN